MARRQCRSSVLHYSHRIQQLMEISVIKIIDGLLLSDLLLPADPQFLLSNKISHLVGFLQPSLAAPIPPEGIKSLVLPRTQPLPRTEHLLATITAITQAKEEGLCVLIYAEDWRTGLGFVVGYMVARFGWSLRATAGFLRRRLDWLGFGGLGEYIQHMQKGMEGVLASMVAVGGLRDIEWTREFLSKYDCDDLEQRLVINTVVNTFGDESEADHFISDKSIRNNQRVASGEARSELETKKTKNNKKRVIWQDQLVINSVTAGQRLFANSKIYRSFKRNSNTVELKPNIKDLNDAQPRNICEMSLNKITQKSAVLNQRRSEKKQKIQRATSPKISSYSRVQSSKKLQIKTIGETDDINFLSLKQMSRTNFNDFKFRSSMRKHRSLKLYKLPNKNSERAGPKISILGKCSPNENSSSALGFIQGVKTLAYK